MKGKKAARTNERARPASPGISISMYEAHVHATNQPKYEKPEEAMDSNRSESTVSRTDIHPHVNVGESSYYMHTKRRPPLSDRNEDTEVRTKKKRKKKNKEEREEQD
ncbi:hypothetical protein MAR_022041 [Mya arenaria]|uniref:Uncharacterized protein n=1 Tax=Mya arenaria TaxID=6604 RepID=A0ABY7ED01_MYAAR|nr:hypothetical protein MAR_022041 [Mya arenaria]